MKKFLVIAIMALTLTGCGKQEAQVVEAEAQEPAMIVVEEQEEPEEDAEGFRTFGSYEELVNHAQSNYASLKPVYEDLDWVDLTEGYILRSAELGWEMEYNTVDLTLETRKYTPVAEQVEEPERTVVRVDDYTEDGMMELLEYMAHAEHTVRVEDMNENGISYVYTVNGTMEFDWNNLTVTQYAE